jgi:protein-S-isoprenylcysteine O-methyltransferase Ste14
MKNLKFNLIKIVTAAALSIFLVRALNAIYQGAELNINLILLVIGEIITVGMTLAARPASDYRINFFAIISTAMATFYFLFVGISGGERLVPMVVTGTLQTISVVWQIVAKVYLGRSFGLMPANRGIVTTGPYKIVRHPIYFGYFLNHIGFLLSTFSLYNLAIYIALYFFQAIRIWQEEDLLKKDEIYASYMQRTQYRFIPGVF